MPATQQSLLVQFKVFMKIPFVDLSLQYQNLKAEIDQAISSVIADTAFIGGKYVTAFEGEFASMYGVNHVVSCANGTDSLYIIMKMLGIGLGDEVITVANSWISSSETISQTGAKPVFVDVHPDYYSLDEKQIESKISPRTKAIIAVHLQGQACAIDEIKAICDAHGIFLIEDCAQSHFSRFGSKNVGLFGIAASFSFYPGKNLGAFGDGGAVCTNNKDICYKVQQIRNNGSIEKYKHEIFGRNSRLDTIQAAILDIKLCNLENNNEKRTLNETGGVILKHAGRRRRSV